LNQVFQRDSQGTLDPPAAEMLYRVHRWEQAPAAMNVVFRDHSLSDLIGFVYSGVPAREAAEDFIQRVKKSCQSAMAKRETVVVPIILDGENAWEFYPRSGREFLRRLYDIILRDPMLEASTISEAVARESSPHKLSSIFPGSWINANFNVWIGAPEDNTAWDHLSAARDFYAAGAEAASPESRALAYEELLIAEGSDWNWWYGPEHHSANDRDFDELYRKHLSNVYLALGGAAPEALAQPIASMLAQPEFTPQSGYVHPEIDGKAIGYFEWLGAATHVADRHTSAMHGRVFLLDTAHAGIDEENLYCRLDFTEPPTEWNNGDLKLVLAIETHPPASPEEPIVHRLEAGLSGGQVGDVTFAQNGHAPASSAAVLARLDTLFECRVPLALLNAPPRSTLRIRFSLWRDRLPLDALPYEGAIEVRVVPENEMAALPYAKP
jgi:hypothetical protein